MSELLKRQPFGRRDEDLFLKEMNNLTHHHLRGCPEYDRIWSGWNGAVGIDDLPYLHVGLFKELDLKTERSDSSHERVLHSSSTSGISSKIHLDTRSSSLQAESSNKILSDYLGSEKLPLLILDSVKSLRQRGSVSAKVAAAMSLKEFASDMIFLLETEDPSSMKLDTLEQSLQKYDSFYVYGFSWILWLAWGKADFPDHIKELIEGKTIKFIHSGGWKKLEEDSVDQETFQKHLLEGVSKESLVLDYYGLVEQIGIVYPLCDHGWRHVPNWADIIIRDIHTLESLIEEAGQIQLMNAITWGAPYHSVLTEDVGIISPAPCQCGRSGDKFRLLGRIPKAELRGCANV